MINNELLSYIEQQLALGVDKEVIRSSLLRQGWPSQDLDMAFSGESFSALPSIHSGDATKNWMALTSLILGIVSLVAWFIPLIDYSVGAIGSVVGVVLGIFGLKSSKRTMATAGIVLSLLGFIVTAAAYQGFYWYRWYGYPSEDENLEQEMVVDDTIQTTAPETLEEQPYLNTKYVFSMHQPRGWKSDESGQFGTAVVFFNPQADREGANDFSANINVTTESTQGLNLNEYVEASKSVLERTLTGYLRTGDRQVNVSGLEGRILEGVFRQGAYYLSNMQLIIVVGGQAFIITGTALESDWGRYSDLIEASLRTFRLEG